MWVTYSDMRKAVQLPDAIVCLIHLLRSRSSALAVALLVGGFLISPSNAIAQQTVLTREEALASVFPGAEISVGRLFLGTEQINRIKELSGEDVPTRIIARYVAKRDGVVIGRSYIDTHVVRTKRQSLLISLDPNRTVRRIDVTAFLEPPEYLAQDQWRQQYHEKSLTRDLQVSRSIRPIAGATLTARAINAAVRRILALDQVYSD